MTRTRQVARAATIAGLFVASAGGMTRVQERPNIIFISIDDLDLDEIGAFQGEGKVWTPHMDRLVQEGLKLTRAHVTSTVCVPSRFSFLTGRYAGRSLYHLQNTPLDQPLNIENVPKRGVAKHPAYIIEGEKTIAHWMNSAGYTTGLVGKWHNDYHSLQRPLEGVIEGGPEDPAIARMIRAQYEEIVKRVRCDSGFDVVDRLYYDNKEQLLCPPELRTFNTPWITEGALEFIEQNRSRPFFLYYANPMPHGKFVRPGADPVPAYVQFDPEQEERAPAEWTPIMRESWLGNRLLATPAGYLDEPPRIQPPVDEVVRRYREQVPDGPPDAPMLTWLDDSIGAILDKLKELGLEDNTVIFFISDHQDIDKFTPFARGTHVPMAVRWPGRIPAGSVSESLVSSVDILPTCLDIIGTRPPLAHRLDGVSMMPLFKNPESILRENLLVEFGYARSVITRDWQYIAVRFPEAIPFPSPENPRLLTGGIRADRAQRILEKHPGVFDPDQLYHLGEDPGQQVNRWGEPGFQEIGDYLKRALQDTLQTFPHPFGEFHPSGEKK